MAKDTRWDRSLSVSPDAEGLMGHAGRCCCASSPNSRCCSLQAWPVRRRGLSFRFSGERPGPHESTTVRLIRPDDLLGHLGVQDRPYVSATVVSTALAAGLCIGRPLTFRFEGGESTSRPTCLPSLCGQGCCLAWCAPNGAGRSGMRLVA